MADKRITDQVTDTTLSAGDYIMVDSSGEGTRKFDLGTKLSAIDTAITAEATARENADSQLKEDLTQEICYSVTEVIATTGQSINYPIPYHIRAGISYLITIESNNPLANIKITTRETSTGANIETVYEKGGDCNNFLFTAEEDANYFKYISSAGATVTISTLSVTDAYSVAKENEQNLKTDASLNNLFSSTGIYKTNQGVRNTADSTITADSQRIGLKIPCMAGDTFSVTGSGASAGRLWCFTDENYKILSVANTSVTATNLELEATANGYFIVNVYTNQPYNIIKHKGQLISTHLQSQINENAVIDVYDEQEVELILYHAIDTSGSVGSTVDVNNPVPNTGWAYAIFPVSEGDYYLLNGYGGSTYRLWCLTDSSYKIISASASSLNAVSTPAVINVTANGYLIINNGITSDTILRKRRTDAVKIIVDENYNNIASIQKNMSSVNDDVTNLINIPLVEFDFNDFEMLDVSDYRSLVEYDDPNRSPMLEQFYNLFDSLVTNYSSYVSRVDAPVECSLSYPTYANGITVAGTYEVTPAYKTYMYQFIDTNAGAGNNAYNAKKKMLITCGTHGNEIMTPFNAFVFASELCKGTDPNYAKLRASYDIYIVPCLNGYGMYHGMRANANWIDINRNFPTNPWHVDGADTIGDKLLCTYTGAVAGSEFETQLVMALQDMIKPDLHIDHHNYSGGDAQFYTNVTEENYLRLVHQALIDISIACVKNYPAYFGNSYMLIVPNRNIDFAPRITESNKNGKMCVWMSQNGTLFSSTIEIASDIRYLNGAITSDTQDWAGNTTFSIAEYTLRNQLLRYGQHVLQLT